MSDQFASTKVWQQVCGILQLKLSPAMHTTWIMSNKLIAIDDLGDGRSVITVSSPSAFHATNLKKNFDGFFKAAFDKVLETDSEIRYIVGSPDPIVTNLSNQDFASSESGNNLSANGEPGGNSYNRPTPTLTTPSSSPSPRVEDLFSQNNMRSAQQDRTQAIARRIGLRSDYIFETFAVSTTNEMAHAAATAVSNRPGNAYNPLFLYGGVGVGKTHLMHAIANNILKQTPDVEIIYCTGEEFTNEIVSAIQTKKASQFKYRYRNTRVLLIDDIQFLAGKNTVQEEFFHTFNSLVKQDSQIVLTSDRPPHEIPLLEDRLRSRFEAGLMIDIGLPSFELRTAILLVKAKASNIDIPIEMAKAIASKVESARKIEGIITSIRSEVELKHREISPELIEEILAIEAQVKRPRINAKPSDIIKTVSNHYRIKQTALKGKRRVKNLVTARHIAMYLMKKELSLPLTEIGQWFSGRDHTSVLHAVNKIEELVETDELMRQDVSALRMTLAAAA